MSTGLGRLAAAAGVALTTAASSAAADAPKNARIPVERPNVTQANAQAGTTQTFQHPNLPEGWKSDLDFQGATPSFIANAARSGEPINLQVQRDRKFGFYDFVTEGVNPRIDEGKYSAFAVVFTERSYKNFDQTPYSTKAEKVAAFREFVRNNNITLESGHSPSQYVTDTANLVLKLTNQGWNDHPQGAISPMASAYGAHIHSVMEGKVMDEALPVYNEAGGLTDEVIPIEAGDIAIFLNDHAVLRAPDGSLPNIEDPEGVANVLNRAASAGLFAVNVQEGKDLGIINTNAPARQVASIGSLDAN